VRWCWSVGLSRSVGRVEPRRNAPKRVARSSELLVGPPIRPNKPSLVGCRRPMGRKLRLHRGFFLARLPHRVFFLRSPQHTVTSSPGSAGRDWSGGYDEICTGVQGLLSSLTVAEVFGRSVRVVRANEYQCRTLALFLRDVCDFACSIRYIYSVVLLKRCVYAWIARDSALPC
jgi:hypothetical protein